jgi:signal transduction histidine kinase
MEISRRTLQIILSDDGKGFEAGSGNGHGNGLINMRKRMEEHAGSFELTSMVGKGTKIELSVNMTGSKSHTKW